MKKVYKGWVYVGHDSDISIYENPKYEGKNIDLGTEIEKHFEDNQNSKRYIKITVEEINLDLD